MATSNKYRGFSIVISNVFFADKLYWENVISRLKYDQVVVSVEEYPKAPGQFHCHIFTHHKNACSKMKCLQFLQQNQIGHIDQSKAAPEGSVLGRIQIDPRRGTMEEATAYLTQELTKKDKVCGTPVAHNNRFIKCLYCEYKNFPVFFNEDYPKKQGQCWRCWKRRRLSMSGASQHFDEIFQICQKVIILQGALNP